MPDMKTWEITFDHAPPLNRGSSANLSDWEGTKVRPNRKPHSLSFLVNDKEDERYVKDVARALDESGDFLGVRVFKEAEREEVDYS